MTYLPFKPTPLNDPFANDRPLRRVLIEDSEREERWPARPPIEPADRVGSDPRTARLIATRRQMERNGFPRLMDLLDEWKCVRTQKSLGDQQGFVRGLIDELRACPAEREPLVMLAWICEPSRRRVASMLVDLLDAATREDQHWHSPTEAEAIRSLDRDRLATLTRRAVLEAFYRYPEKPRGSFVSWVQEVISLRAIQYLRDNMAGFAGSRLSSVAARQVGVTLRSDEAAQLGLAPADGFAEWLAKTDYETVFKEDVEPLTRHLKLRRICGDAVERLGRRQEQVMTDRYWGEKTPAQIAAERGIQRQTVYSTQAQAERRMGRDATFYSELRTISALRADAQLEPLRLPDRRHGEEAA